MPINWHVVFFDEAHKVKSTKAKLYGAAARIRTHLRYGLTGTAMQARCFLQMAVCDASPACNMQCEGHQPLTTSMPCTLNFEEALLLPACSCLNPCWHAVLGVTGSSQESMQGICRLRSYRAWWEMLTGRLFAE